MRIENEELLAVLGQFNPWWQHRFIPDLPEWHRAVFSELQRWVVNPPAARAIFLSGARQVGKTTLLMQSIQNLLKMGVPAENILYATFDHPIIKLAGVDQVLEAWRIRESKQEGMEYIFLDEAQFIKDWGTWIKHQVDFFKHRRIIFTGSAIPILQSDQESGVGRWHNIRLTTLSFYEYIKLKKVVLPSLPTVKSLKELFLWPRQELRNIGEIAQPYVGHFHSYLLHGGFPQTALIESITQAQKLLREDIIDKAIKRDMTALFGVRRVLDLEQTFLYLCLNDGGILDVGSLSSNLQVTRQTAQHFIDLLEASHLIFRLPPFGYGKEILRGRYKIYLADAAIAPAVMLKGRSVIDNPDALGVAAETATLKHLFTHYYQQNIRFAYWRDSKGQEVDLIAEGGGQVVPFEVKYRSQIDMKSLKGIIKFCNEKKLNRGYIISKSLKDIGFFEGSQNSHCQLFFLPATLLCYWMGEMELALEED
ncbi:MAG: ATP-binding protein [Alphaproteobacteria bacterium]|nr:ATP-binding protein [Alphaproteobacteria bacterium]OJV45425.1 MAG: ATPase [Alphaproteobacteria bacterium 43-37]